MLEMLSFVNMLFSRRKRDQDHVDIWPGFVDALSTVLLVFIFVLVGFIASQVYLSGIIFDKDSSISNMKDKLAAMCSVLNVEKDKNAKLNQNNKLLSEQILELNKTIESLQSMFNNEETLKKEEIQKNASLEEKITNLTKQLKDVMQALESEHKNSKKQKEDLESMRKENIKLNNLNRISAYRSEFFDKLQDIVKDKEGIKIAGDRFVFQSELFFESASDQLSETGKEQVSKLATIIKELAKKIPSNISWLLRVDGHTDKRPITSPKFASNWELSAARAISVVKYLIDEGIESNHLVAAGFGDSQPISTGSSDEELAKNRRIEFKLDQR